jgi:hypothetical protein
MPINPFLKNPWSAMKARWSKQMGNSQGTLFTTPTYNTYNNQNYAVDNNFPEMAWNAAGTNILETYRRDTDDKLRIGGEQINPMAGTINFPLTTSASIVTQQFFIAPFPMRIVSISEVHAVANGAALTAYITKDASGTVPGAGQQIMAGTFNLNATAQTVQTATLPVPNPTSTTSNGSSAVPYIYLATGDRLSFKMSTTVTSLAGLEVAIGYLPGGKSNIQVFNMQANGDLSDQAFFLALQPCIVSAAYACVSTAGTNGSAVSVQITKDTSTDAPGAGTDILTNNTNAGFNLKNTINTIETGTLTATAATLRLAPGDRLSVDFNGTLTAVAGLVIVVVLEPILRRKFITLNIKANAGIVDQQFFVADRPYYIDDASAVWSTAAASGNIQLTVDKATDAPGAGVDLLSMDTNAGWQVDGTANTPERATWKNTQFNHILAGDRISIDCAVGASIAGFVCTLALIPE